MSTHRRAVLAAILHALREMESHPEEVRGLALSFLQDGVEFLMKEEMAAEDSAPDATLEELRRVTSRVLNHEPGISWSEVERMATLVQMLDALAYDMGSLPTAWAAAVRRTDEAAHTEAAAAAREALDACTEALACINDPYRGKADALARLEAVLAKAGK